MQIAITGIACRLPGGLHHAAAANGLRLEHREHMDGAEVVHVALDRSGSHERRSGRWLIGADGGRSDVRRALGVDFAGFT